MCAVMRPRLRVFVHCVAFAQVADSTRCVLSHCPNALNAESTERNRRVEQMCANGRCAAGKIVDDCKSTRWSVMPCRYEIDYSGG
jgi:hypothetical protein